MNKTVVKRRKTLRDGAMGQSMRLVRKSVLFKQEWKRKNPDQLKILEQLRDPDQCPILEDILVIVQDDLEFLFSCFSICMETCQFKEKFLPFFCLAEEWISENRLMTAPTNNSKSNISSNVNNTNSSNRSVIESTQWLYNYCFCLAVDAENVSALERLLAKAAESKHLPKPPEDNNDALLRACELNNFEMVKMMVSNGYRLRSFHRERQKKLKENASPIPFFPFNRSVTKKPVKDKGKAEVRDIGDEVNELHILRMLARPAYILSCYAAVATSELENIANQETPQCSCSNTLAKNRLQQGLKRTQAKLEEIVIDQPDNGIGLQAQMANIIQSHSHECPLHNPLKPSQNCRVHCECNDPIFRCFDLAKAASKLANKTPEYRSEYEDVARQCRNLSVQLLDQCSNTEEVQTLLSESSGTSKYFRYSGFIKYPRIRLAIEHNHKEFVGHMYCQQMLRQEWHGDVPWLGKSFKYRFIYSVLLTLFAPLFIAFWSITQVGKDIQWLRKTALPNEDRMKDMNWMKRTYYKYLNYCSTVSRTIDNPLNRFIIFSGFYIVYLVFMISAINKPIPEYGKSYENPYRDEEYDKNYKGLTIYALAMVWQDLKIAITLRSVKTFFQKFWRAFDLFMHFTLCAALITRAIFLNYTKCDERDPDNPDDDFYECPRKILIKASNGLLTLAATASIIRVIYWFLLHDTIGPVVINMSRAILDILTIAITFAFVLFAFASGMVFLVAERNKYLTHTNTSEWRLAVDGTQENVTHIGYTKMMVTLLWTLFEPKKPEFFGDDEHDDDAYASIGYTMFAIYLLIIVVILLNLLIAIMNATVQKVHDRKQLYWKFARTSVWMEFFDDELSSPPIPFSFVQVIWSATFFTVSGFLQLWRILISKNKKSGSNGKLDSAEVADEKRQYRTKHVNLMLDITDRYAEKQASTVNNVGTRNNSNNKLDNNSTFVFNTMSRKAFTFKNRQN